MTNLETLLDETSPSNGLQPEIQERAEDMEITRDVELATGVTHHPTNFQAQVQDDQGQQLIQTPSNQTVTITIPATQQQLVVQSKGDITESVTWFALYWLRIIKKAAFHGWQTVIRGGNNAN